MEDFLMRTITNKSKEYKDISVSKMRTSKGFSMVTIDVGEKRIEFSSDKDGFDYEKRVIELLNLLDEVSGASCTLPESK